MDILNTEFRLTPPGRTGHVAVTYEKYMFVWGGYRQHVSSPENPGVFANTYFNGSEIWIYSSLSEKWYLKKCLAYENQLPPGMSGSAAVIIDNALYLFGGYGCHKQECTNNLYKLDLEFFIWANLKPSGVAPTPVDKMVGWQYNKKFYIFGGFGNPDNGAYNFHFVFHQLLWRGWTNQFFAYDPKENCWTRPDCSGDLPNARAAHAAAVIQDKVYIFGGRHRSSRLNDLHCLDMKTMHWTGEIKVKGPTPEGRSWHSLTALSNDILILYGGFSQHNEALSDCWMFDTKEEFWRKIELPFAKPRLWHCATLNVYDEVLVFGGCTSNILDLERTTEQANDVIVIRISPKSLFRICVDQVLSHHSLRSHWSSLPQTIRNILQLRSHNFLSSNLDGS